MSRPTPPTPGPSHVPAPRWGVVQAMRPNRGVNKNSYYDDFIDEEEMDEEFGDEEASQNLASDGMSDDEDEFVYDSDDEEEDDHEISTWTNAIPYGTTKEIKKKVKGKIYRFKYHKDGTLDFEKPLGTPVAIVADVNVIDPMTNKLKYTGAEVSDGRAAHFKVANMIRQGITSGTPTDGSKSPSGLTWHHHANPGRLQLMDRAVHKAFPHHGGEAIWGKKK